MAFKGPIFTGGGEAKTSSIIQDAIGQGMTVLGVQETAGNFRDWASHAVYVTAFTSKRTAEAVFQKSQRHVPYRSGELYDSGFVGTVEGSPMGDFPRFTVIDENIEGTVAAYAKNLAVKGSFTAPSGFFGARVFTKYAVGYTADHAVMVHENPMGQEWRQDTKSPWPDHKEDHFLLNAYHAYQHRYSGAMRLGLKIVEEEIGKRAEKQAAALKGTGAPRLVKRSV